MHISGKILAWMAVAGAAAAVVLTARTLELRGGWIQELEELQEQNQKNAQDIAATEKEVERLKRELNENLRRWGRYWTGVEINAGADGRLTSSTWGTNAGLGVPQNGEPPVVYAFQPADDGYQYVGEFRATTLRENRAALQLTRQARPGETSDWQSGRWHFRTLIAPSYHSRFSTLHKRLAVARESVERARSNLNDQQELLQHAQNQLEVRKQELFGQEDDPQKPGLVARLHQAEEKRNTTLAEVDDLRHALKQAVAARNRLIQENRQLVGTLPQPQSAETAQVTGK